MAHQALALARLLQRFPFVPPPFEPLSDRPATMARL